MTTKKQRREQVAAKRARYDAESRRMGLEALRVEREKREQSLQDADREAKTRKAKR